MQCNLQPLLNNLVLQMEAEPTDLNGRACIDFFLVGV